MSRWHYLWRRYLGWFPVQFCMVCGRAYWGGLPCPSIMEIRAGRFWGWLPWWKDYCSKRCADIEMEMLG